MNSTGKKKQTMYMKINEDLSIDNEATPSMD